MEVNKYTGKAEYAEYEDGRRVLLSADDSPPFTDEEWRNAPRINPADLLPPAFLQALRDGRVGRPKKENKRKQVSLRLDPDVLEAWRASGANWQSRINEVLRNHAPS